MNKKLVFIVFLVLFLSGVFVFFKSPVLASSTDGVIDPTYKYAWGENIGWIDFGTTNGDVRVTDSGLSGYALGENIGWINLASVVNNSEGYLSGYAWSENAGWINFAPTNGGVIINSSGEFTGSALGENIGWIIFGGDYKVKTDWRPQSSRVCTSWTYSDWNSCSNSQQTRTVVSSSPSGCSGGSPTLSQSCGGGGGGGGGMGYYLTSTPSANPTPTPTPEKPIVPEIIKKISEIIPKTISKIAKIFKPKPTEIKSPEIPIEQLVSKETPLSLRGRWELLTQKSVGGFVLAPLPVEIVKLAEKFPELGETFKQVGITKMTDIGKLRSVGLTLPGLTESAQLSAGNLQVEKMTGIKGVPIAKLTSQEKAQIPSDIVFTKTGGELVDFNIALSLNDKGEPEQKIETIAGKPMFLTIKPDPGVRRVRGFIVFKSKQAAMDYQNRIAGKENIDNFGTLVLNHGAQEANLANAVFGVLPRKVDVLNPADNGTTGDLALDGDADKQVLGLSSLDQIENRLILQQFEYTDPDGDGIFTATINAPVVDGEYEVITVMDYLVAGRIVSKEVRMTTVVDPEGYVFEKNGDKETRIPGAVISIFHLNGETTKYDIWPAQDFQQENPHVTDVTGKYSFLVPPGNYYILVEAPGYMVYEGKPFEVKEGLGVHFNIELKPKDWWLKIVDWKTILLAVVIILLLYNFYRDKMREMKEKFMRSKRI